MDFMLEVDVEKADNDVDDDDELCIHVAQHF